MSRVVNDQTGLTFRICFRETACARCGRHGFTLVELTITLLVGTILMFGMLPLIRLAVNSGAQRQLQMRDTVELQSLVERLSAWNAQNNLAAIKAALGSPGAKSGIGLLGDFYLHSADYIYFDGSYAAQITNGVSDLLEVRVGLSQTGPSLSKIYGN